MGLNDLQREASQERHPQARQRASRVSLGVLCELLSNSRLRASWQADISVLNGDEAQQPPSVLKRTARLHAYASRSVAVRFRRVLRVVIGIGRSPGVFFALALDLAE